LEALVSFGGWSSAAFRVSDEHVFYAAFDILPSLFDVLCWGTYTVALRRACMGPPARSRDFGRSPIMVLACIGSPLPPHLGSSDCTRRETYTFKRRRFLFPLYQESRKVVQGFLLRLEEKVVWFR